MVDPTWQNTTGGFDYFASWDTNHIAFSILGLDSTGPAPAGTYKIDQTSHDVIISYHQGDLALTQPPKLGLRVDPPGKITAGLPAGGSVTVDNYGPTLFTGDQLTLSTKTLDIFPSRTPIGVLPPFASQTVNFSLSPTGILESKNDIIAVNFAGQHRSYPVTVQPFYKNNFLLVVGSLTVLGSLSLIAQIARSLYLQRRKRDHNLHREG